MKKLLLTFGGLLALSVAARAEPETEWREALRNVVTTNGLKVVACAATNTVGWTVPSTNTPAYAGQFFFGQAGVGTSGVWAAKGLTTNDWVRLAP